MGRPASVLFAAGSAALAVLALSRPGRVPVPPPASHDVRILRDTWGVPHVFGKTDADVAYGLAWAHAEDDFPTIQGALLAARGKLATVYGQAAAPNDYMVQLLRVWDAVDAHYESDLSPETRAVCEAYAQGLTDYAARNPDRALPGLYPVRGKDVVAGFVHKLPLFFGLDRTLRALFEDAPRPGTRAGAASDSTAAPPFGSNAFAVAPSRSADGATRLAINSHQPWEGPVAWYEAHLHSEQGWDMVGGVFPGAPIVLHGHNRDLGWAHTVNRPDLIDVFVLDVNPQNPNQYRFDGQWRDLEVRDAPITVKLLGPLHWTFHREALWSAYGPVVRRPSATYAIRFAGQGDVRAVEQWYRMNKARTFEEWTSAVALRGVPALNVVYADRRGNIQYLYNARLPRRAEAYDWSADVPGNTSATLWTQTLPLDALPQVTNPPSGFVQNCNNSPFRTTTGEGNPNPAHYSATLGIETGMTNRSLRALELLGSDTAITRDEFEAYKFDRRYSTASTTADRFRRLVLLRPPADPVAREALDLVRTWDLSASPESPAATLALLTLRPKDDDQPAPASTLLLMERLRQAAVELKQTWRTLEVPWGEMNRLRRGPVDLPLGGAPDVLNAVYATRDPDGRLRGIAGDSYLLLVEWDAQGRVHSRSLHQYGSATLDESSPHYADQARLFAERRLKPVWMDEVEIRAHLERAYVPGAP